MGPSLKWYEGALCHNIYRTGIVAVLVRNIFTCGNVLGVSSPFVSERESSSPMYFSSHSTLSSSILLFTQAHVYSSVLMMFG